MSRRLLTLALIGIAAAAPLAAVAAGWDWYFDGLISVLVGIAFGYLAGTRLPRRGALVAVLAATMSLVTAQQIHDARHTWLNDAIFFLAIVGGAAAAGEAVTMRTQQVRRLERLQTELDAQERLAVATARLNEQNRIHHQVHTRLAERIAGIAVWAEGARRSADEAALEVIETEARGVLDQLRDALGSMRGELVPGELARGEWVRDELLKSPSPTPDVRRPRPSAVDIALAVAIGAAMAVETSVAEYARGPVWANVIAALLATVPLSFRRRSPIVSGATALTVGCVMSVWLTPIPATVTGLAILAVIFYSIGAWCGRWWWLLGWATAAAGTVAVGLVSGVATGTGQGDVVLVLVGGTGALALGRVAAAWQARALRITVIVDGLRQARGAAVELATARERESIAGELHDTVAHAMTVVCLHAGAARVRAGDAEGALATISATATASLAELRDGIDTFESAEHPLDPGRIAAVGRRVGVNVALVGIHPDGAAAALGFRVVREAIVNIARHAPGASATVTVQREHENLSIEIADSGSALPSASIGTGTGLTGLARAVEASGGSMAWGARPGGGYQVAVTIPEEAP